MARQLDSDGTGSPLATALRHAKLLSATTLLGIAAGGAAGYALPVSYSAETRVAVGAGSDSAYAIAGYPVAARELAQNYSRWVQNNAVDGTWAPEGVNSVSATPIPESGVIRVEASSPDEAKAVAGADAVAQELLGAAKTVGAQRDAAAALQEYQKLATGVAEAQTAVSLAESAFGRSSTGANARELAAARGALAEAQLIQGAQGDRYRRLVGDPVAVSQLTQISPAASTGDNRNSNIAFGAAAGGGLGLILAFCLAAVGDLRSGRSGRHSRAAAERDASPAAES
ncbi:MAG: hypothetical protein Q4G51_13770 [Dermatophilus congolensis]|nr:hypothetical protein [Dermatophilus congolensis]